MLNIPQRMDHLRKRILKDEETVAEILDEIRQVNTYPDSPRRTNMLFLLNRELENARQSIKDQKRSLRYFERRSKQQGK